MLLFVAGALIFQMAAPDEEWARLVTIGLQGSVVLAALDAAGADRRMMGVAGFGMALLFLIATITLLGLGAVGPAVPRVVSLLLVLLAPIGIAIGLRRELSEDGRVTLETVFGGLCMYLLLGLAFAFAFALTEDVSGNPFFANDISGTSNDFLYFSLATLTTTGYGDLSAATDFGRTLSVTEALAGQIYLVTVVALLVGNLGRSRSGSIAPEAARQLAERRRGAPDQGRGGEV